MKLRDLKQHPAQKRGCVFFLEGGAYSVWLNPSNPKIASVSRHREIKEALPQRQISGNARVRYL